MKIIALIFFFSNAIFSLAQEKMIAKLGVINFEASVPFFEEVKATNEKTFCSLEPKKSVFTCIAVIKGFRFKKELMENHFNENYLESERFPKAIFIGIIEKFDLKNIDTEAKEYLIKGKIKIHGNSKNIEVIAKLKRVKEGIELTSNFDLNTDDFKIEIPFMVRSKISKNVKAQIDCVLN